MFASSYALSHQFQIPTVASNLSPCKSQVISPLYSKIKLQKPRHKLLYNQTNIFEAFMWKIKNNNVRLKIPEQGFSNPITFIICGFTHSNKRLIRIIPQFGRSDKRYLLILSLEIRICLNFPMYVSF